MSFIVFPKTLKHFIVSFVAEVSGELCYGETEQWFFFTSRQEREARGGKPNRTTASGYWKATGSPCYVYSSDNRVIGVKKTMVFYKGRAPSGRKTKWKMNEYTAIIIEEDIPSRKLIPKLRRELSLCRVYVTSGRFGAYDRRPLGPAVPQAHGHKAESDPTVELAGSPESSSRSGEEHIVEVAQAGEMVNGLEPLWEWENWL